MRKKLFIFLLVFVFSTSLAYAEELQRVFDNANCFSPDGPGFFIGNESTVSSWNEQMLFCRENKGYDRCVVTIDDFIGYDTHEAFADAFYHSMNIGVGEEHTGILILIDINQNRIYLHTVGKMNDYLSSFEKEKVIEAAMPMMEKQAYEFALNLIMVDISDIWIH